MSDYTIEFYEDRHGFCPIAEWLRGLDQSNSKLNKSMLKKVYFQLERLAREGPLIGEPIVKKLDSEIWELRPILNIPARQRHRYDWRLSHRYDRSCATDMVVG